jgi:hypothetical protein
MDFVQNLDPSKLALAATGLSFVLALGACPPYNLPILLFGCYAQENNAAVQSLQTFTTLLGVSFIFDIVWIIKNDQHGLFKFLSILLLLLKIPTFFAFLMSLRQRGGNLGLSFADSTGPTVWSMPGGFTSSEREGYQTVADDNSATFLRGGPTRAPASQPAVAAKQTPPPPGNYQVV